jgi:hypothetical protein
MVLRFWGEREITADTFAPLVDRSAAGIRTTTLINALLERGWNATAIEGTDAILARELANGRPVIALIEDRPHVFHYVVIVGVTDRAVLFHDPARAPLRVMARDLFDRRWRAADRWMAIVLPPGEGRDIDSPARSRDDRPLRPPGEVRPAASTASCEERVAVGVNQAQAGDLDAAEQTLAGALTCPGSAAPRELAGVRFLQRRWDDAAELASQAVSIDQSDAYAWRLLGTSRFLLNQPLPALDAWNRVGEPRLDLVRVDGLERTRQRPVERMVGIRPGAVVTASNLVRADRAVSELPSARSTRLELRPVGEGLAELHLTLVERGVVPRDPWTWAVIGARAAAARSLDVSLGSLAGAGESIAIEYRFWPDRPRIAASLRAPAPWPGTWGVDVSGESQAFDASHPELQRRGGRLVASRWFTHAARIEARSGAERWNSVGTLGTVGATAGWLSGAERVSARIAADGWAGSVRFGSFSATVHAASAPRMMISHAAPLGPIVTLSGGSAIVTESTPLDRWPAADTGQARSVLARAHPVLDGGRMRVSRLGRSVAFGSGEAQYWWKAPAFARVGAAMFVDAVRTMQRSGGLGPIDDVDLGAGVGLASLLVPGRLRIDYAHGLRDGADAVTLRFVVSAW